jgi:hypothetical protein
MIFSFPLYLTFTGFNKWCSITECYINTNMRPMNLYQLCIVFMTAVFIASFNVIVCSMILFYLFHADLGAYVGGGIFMGSIVLCFLIVLNRRK